MGDQNKTGTRILCEGELRVSVGGAGSRALLDVRDGTAVRFWADTEALEKVLPGGELRIDAHGGHCKLRVEGEQANIELVVEDQTPQACTFPTHDLADALIMVRDLGPGPDPDLNGNSYLL